jgi:signal transduction histidine kinase
LLYNQQKLISFLTATIRNVALKQSHLIRKPLANIVGLVDMLEEMTDDAGIQTIVNVLKASTEELNNEFESFLISDEPVKKDLKPLAKLNFS